MQNLSCFDFDPSKEDKVIDLENESVKQMIISLKNELVKV